MPTKKKPVLQNADVCYLPVPLQAIKAVCKARKTPKKFFWVVVDGTIQISFGKSPKMAIPVLGGDPIAKFSAQKTYRREPGSWED